MKSVAVSAVLCLVLGAGTLAAQQDTSEVGNAVIRGVKGRSALVDVFLIEDAQQARPGLWVAFAARIPMNQRLRPTLHLCTVLDDVPLRTACVALPTLGVVNSEIPFAAESLAFDDIDGDGEIEARATIRYETAGGDADRLFVVDLEPRPRIAFSAETRRFTEAGGGVTVRRPVMFTDANADQHNDAVVEETTCRETATADRCTPVRRTIWMWNPRTDLWALFRAR